MSQENYFRRITGPRPGWRTRRSCFHGDSFEFGFENEQRRKGAKAGQYVTSHPCPLCRDWKLLVNYRNTPLLNQFIDKNTGLQLPAWQTSLCTKKYNWIAQSIDAARQLGYLPYPSLSEEQENIEWDVDAFGEMNVTNFRRF